MKTLEKMPATVLPLPSEVNQQEQVSRAARGARVGENPRAQLQDGLDVDVFHVGFLVEMIVRRI